MPTFDRSKSGKKRHRKGKLTVKKLAKQVKAMMPKPEWKFFDAVLAALIVTNNVGVAGQITNLLAPAQGTTDITRIGNKVTCRSIFIRLSMIPSAVALMNFLRVMIVKDKQPNTAVFAGADLLQANTNYQSPLNDNNGTRFKILFDRTYTVDADANGSQVDKIFKKTKFVVNFPDNTTTPTTNALYLVLISDQAVNGPTVQYYSRVRYIDA